jgi:phosphoribosylaminoimidazolecarboxamide formyltransferase/IMP cyclohydrolase
MARVERALVSVADKAGIVDFCTGLAALGIEIVSTGGTAELLRLNKLPVRDVAEITGYPEMMDGRLKTLHPAVHGGILARRDYRDHVAQMKEHKIPNIDLVAVNLYPFEAAVARGASFDEIIEQIDIGGPTIVRAAAKNHAHVVVVVDAADYARVLDELKNNKAELTDATRLGLAQSAFRYVARYDAAIANYLDALGADRKPAAWGESLTLQFKKIRELRYGENPHQRAAFYADVNETGPSIAGARQLQGKELSFNNILDADAALRAVREFAAIATVVIKHTNPCGAAVSSESLVDSFRKARAADPVSIFGGVVAFNRPLDAATARELKEIFLEIVVAPGFDPGALEILGEKRLRNLRLLEVKLDEEERGGYDLRRVKGGLLAQDWDKGDVAIRDAKVVTKKKPTDDEYRALDFAWRVARHVKSNAIVFASGDQLLGVGAGQMSRVDSVKLAVMRATAHRLDLKGAAVGSDAFFPFRDGVDEIAKAGAKAIAQPGGSIKDQEVIAAADEHGIAMVFTGMRHFRH